MLRVLQPTEAPPPLFVTTSMPVDFVSGFYGEEGARLDRFRWMSREGKLAFPPGDGEGFLEVWIYSDFFDLSQTLSVRSGEAEHDLTLVHGWALYSVPVTAAAGEATLRLSKLVPASHHPDDPRSLGVPVRAPRLHADPERHRHVARQHENAVLNTREMLAGAAVPRSTPPNLGIDLHGVCNVKPPCVYCDWDVSKDAEGGNVDVPFTRETLERYGAFFDQSKSLVNCSIGEPFMMKNLDELLDIFGNQGKTLEMATNGQILTERNIAKLLGREISLYISLDAATPETYARLRNDKFERILDNLRRLVEAKGAHKGLPRIYLVFMPMKANVHELEDFVRLCAELQVDQMVLRPLNYSDAMDLSWDRGGYHFDYPKELLPFDQLIRVSGRAAELCRRHGVSLADQLDFGEALQEQFSEAFEEGGREAGAAQAPAAAEVASAEASAAEAAEMLAQEPAAPAEDEPEAGEDSLGRERLPVCQEPWKSLYILRRGTFPCCYGGEPVAGMEEWEQAWSSPLLQEIRRDLAAGRFHRYCLDSPACPLIRKGEEARSLPPRQRMLLAARHLFHRLDRAGLGVPRKLYRRLKGIGRRLGLLEA
jgi:sulfatase maturation enzyme AslB (radical SAM superfamily)